MTRTFSAMLAAALCAAIFACTSAPDASAQAQCRTFVGNVASAPAQMCLKVEGQALSGSYFYFKRRTPIDLSGSLDAATGAFELTEKSGGAETGRWTGTLDAKSGVVSGTFSAGKAGQPLFFYDAAHEPLRTEKHVQKTYASRCNKDDPEDPVGRVYYFSHGFTWDEIAAAENPAVADAVNTSARQWVKSRDGYAKEATSPPACKDKAWEYNEDRSVHVAMAGRFLVAVTYVMGGYTGGAHPYEGASLKYFDLRTGKEVAFLDLFTQRGKDLLEARVQADLVKENAEVDRGAGYKPPACKIDLNAVWSFAFERGSYIPWRLDGKRDRTGASPEDLRFWNISYGAYAFGCTGRPGYEMYDLPEEVVASELNPAYFDPKTRFFYK